MAVCNTRPTTIEQDEPFPATRLPRRIDMDPNRWEPQAPRSSETHSSTAKLRRTNTSSAKHDISFLLNGPRNSTSTSTQGGQQVPSPVGQPRGEAEAIRKLWKEQQLWARNEIHEVSTPGPSRMRSSHETSWSLTKTHVKRTCAQCGKSFTQSADLKKHINCVHLKVRAFKCEQCPSAFGEKGNLNRHVKAVHGREKPWICNKCGMPFPFRDSLTRHVRAVHLATRPFACDLCNSTFKKKDHLDRHRYALHGRRNPSVVHSSPEHVSPQSFNRNIFICDILPPITADAVQLSLVFPDSPRNTPSLRIGSYPSCLAYCPPGLKVKRHSSRKMYDETFFSHTFHSSKL
ncbi:unnamed protein product [Agarophyton chilense]